MDGLVTAPLFVPPKGAVRDLSLVVPRGRALAFVAQPMGNGETLKTRIDVESDDAAIAVVERTTEMNQFVVVGRQPGRTTLRVRDERGDTVPSALLVEVVSP
ncbi:hypothetical protein WME94_18100 [Sorangium sp. So ce429]